MPELQNTPLNQKHFAPRCATARPWPVKMVLIKNTFRKPARTDDLSCLCDKYGG